MGGIGISFMPSREVGLQGSSLKAESDMPRKSSTFPAIEEGVWDLRVAGPLGGVDLAANLPGCKRWGGEQRKPNRVIVFPSRA